MDNVTSSRQPKPVEPERIRPAQRSISDYDIQLNDSALGFEDSCQAEASMIRLRTRFKTFDEMLKTKTKKLNKEEAIQEEVERVELASEVIETAEHYQSNNYELESKSLLALNEAIQNLETADAILKEVLKYFSDPSLADDALNFLLEANKGALADLIKEAKNILNRTYQKEILAGKNVKLYAQTLSKDGLGSPTENRNLYRAVIQNPKTALELFEELSTKYTYDSLKKVARFLLHALGSELKVKGPSIPRGELARILNDILNLQALLGVFRFFKSKDSEIKYQFDHYGILQPKILTFEFLAKNFVRIIKEKYISVEKIKNFLKMLGISQELLAQIITLSHLRDALRNTSRKLYQSNKQRQEILDAMVETLEELEEELEESEEEE